MKGVFMRSNLPKTFECHSMTGILKKGQDKQQTICIYTYLVSSTSTKYRNKNKKGR